MPLCRTGPQGPYVLFLVVMRFSVNNRMHILQGHIFKYLHNFVVFYLNLAIGKANSAQWGNFFAPYEVSSSEVQNNADWETIVCNANQ